jgi:hypothetical protein
MAFQKVFKARSPFIDIYSLFLKRIMNGFNLKCETQYVDFKKKYAHFFQQNLTCIYNAYAMQFYMYHTLWNDKNNDQ